MEKQSEEGKQKELDREASQNEQIRETGQAVLDGNSRKHKVELLTVIGEIEGHESAPSHSKTTKYEHVLPKLALIEDDEEIEGLLILLNTVGGDVEAGLAIAEMIASLSIPTVSLVLGGGHSIGVPMAVSADYSFIVPSATMVVHPVRQNGMFIGVAQSYRNMEKIQDRIIAFVSGHSHITPERNVHRRGAVLPQYGKDPGPDHCLCIRTFTYHGRTDGGADAGYLPACKRCGDYAGG